MALDPSIILGARPAQFDMAQFSPMNALTNLMKFRQADQESNLNAMKMQEYERARTEEQGLRQYLSGGPEVEAPDLASPETRRNLLRYGKAGAAQAEALSKQDTAALTQKKAEFEIQKSRKDFIAQAQRDTSQNPSDANITAYKEDLMANPLFTNAEKAQMAKGADRILAMPVDQRQQFMASQGASASELKPTLTPQDFGGGKRVITTPAFGGAATLVPGSEITKTPTFADITSQGQLAVSQGQLKVSQGQLKVAQDRLAKDGAALDPAENAAISKAIIEGRLDPNRVNGRNAKILATTLLANPDANVLELGVSASGATAAERSLATQTAKMCTAANEANKMVDVVRTLSDKVDRTEFPTVNAITNAVSKGTGGKEIVQLNASINALVNSYARAISPTGQPTVSDKNHAREVINSAYSTGQISAILDVMQQEMSIAREAAGTASTELKASREKARGRGEKPEPAASTGQWKVVR